MKQRPSTAGPRQDRIASTREAREQQMIAKAERLAEKKLEDGTASPQIIVHYLRLATEKERLDREALKADVALKEAKIEALQSAVKIEALYEDAMKMFRKYHGEEDGEVSDL